MVCLCGYVSMAEPPLHGAVRVLLGCPCRSRLCSIKTQALAGSAGRLPTYGRP